MNVTCRFGLASIVVEREHTLTLMIRIDAPPAPKQTERRPLNLGLVLDCSGSMGGPKIEHAKAAASHLIQHLRPTDRVAIVAYDSNVYTLLASRALGDKREHLAQIGRLQAGSSTNLSGGWLAGLSQVELGRSDTTSNRALLLTDGLANVGITDPPHLRRIGAEHRTRGITTTTLGFGADFNELLLRDIANDSGGAFYFISSPDTAPGVFTEELGELLSVVGQNLVIELRGQAPAQVIAILNEYPSERIENGFRIHVGDLFGDEQREIVAEMLVPGLRGLGPHQVGSIVVELDQVVDPIRHHRIELPVNINAVTPDQAPAAPDPEVEASANLLRVNEIRRRLIELIRRGEIGEARQQLSDARKQFERRGTLDIEAQREFDRIAAEIDLAERQREIGLKRMDFQAYAVSTGKAEYRQRSSDPTREMLYTGLRGMVQLQPATRELEADLMALDATLQQMLAPCLIRATVDVSYWSIVEKLLGAETPQGQLSPEQESQIYHELRRRPRGDVRIVFGPWMFADGRFSHWYPDSQLALAATGDFVVLAGLPLPAFFAYEALLQGLRVFRGYDPDALMHAETRGCLFDRCQNKPDIRRKLTAGKICDACTPALEQFGIPVAHVNNGLALIAKLAQPPA